MSCSVASFSNMYVHHPGVWLLAFIQRSFFSPLKERILHTLVGNTDTLLQETVFNWTCWWDEKNPLHSHTSLVPLLGNFPRLASESVVSTFWSWQMARTLSQRRAYPTIGTSTHVVKEVPCLKGVPVCCTRIIRGVWWVWFSRERDQTDPAHR